MSPQHSTARETFEFYLNDPELAATLPSFPKLLNGVHSLPYGSDALLMLGGKDAQVIKGQNARLLLASLLPLLDGHKSITDICNLLTERMRPRAREMLALLWHRGLLENGPADQGGAKPLGDFVSRYINVSRHYKNHTQILTDISQFRLLLVASPAVFAEIQPMLAELNLRELLVSHTAEMPAKGDFNIILGIEDNVLQDLAAVGAHARAHQIPFFFSSLAEDAIQVGPLFMSAMSGSYACMKADQLFHASAEQHERTDDATLDHPFWLACICHHFVIAVSKTAINPPLNIYHRYQLDGHGYSSETISFSPVPGAVNGVLEHYTPLTKPGARQAWELHSRIRMPTKALNAPSLYLKHYSPANRKATTAARPRFHSSNVIALPVPAPAGDGGRLTLGTLSFLLKNSYGLHTADGLQRPLAPSGGSLGSPDAYIVVRDIDGLENGLYRYRNTEHALEGLIDPATPLFMNAIGQQGQASRQCYLIGIAAYGRVSAKYGDMAFKVTNLDAGVAQWYVTLAAQQLGIDCCPLDEVDPGAVMEVLQLPAGSHFYTHMIALGEAEQEKPTHGTLTLYSVPVRKPTPPVQSARLVLAELPPATVDNVLLARRATRRFFAEAVDEQTLLFLVESAWRHLSPTSGDVTLSRAASDFFSIWVVCPFGLCNGTKNADSGLYRYLPETRRLLAVNRFESTAALRFSNQNSLAAASAMVIVTMNMENSLTVRGGAAYRLGFQSTGRALADIWLNSMSMGYQGTISGGVLDDGLIEFGGSDGYNHAALAMFAFGHVNPEAVAKDYAQY